MRCHRRRPRLIYAVAVLAAFAGPPSSAEDWPQFRGPRGLGVSSERGLPVTWSDNENIVWKTPLPGVGTSSPITLGERIFLTCHSGYGTAAQNPGDMQQLRRQVVCLSRQGGKIMWTKEVASALPEEPYKNRMLWHGYASSTPAADDQRVYAFFGKSGVFAFDHDGKQLWHADVGSKSHEWGSDASVVLHKDLAIINACVESGALVALHKDTGKEAWRVPGIRESWNTPLLVDIPGGRTELVVAVFGKVLGIDPSNGKQLWSCKGIDYYIVPSMVARQGIVFCIGGRNYQSLAVRAGGKGDVSASHVIWRSKLGSNVSSPVYHDGHLYFAHENNGVAYCVDAKNGNTVYEERLPRIDNIYASPVVGDGKLYYMSRQSGTLALAAGPKFNVLAHNRFKSDRSTFNASPVVDNGKLLLRSDRFLYGIGVR